MATAYDENGDMNLFRENGDGQFERVPMRQVGWFVNGGSYDKWLIGTSSMAALDHVRRSPHGSISPVYVEVGTD